MARYIDADYIFECFTCRHFDGDECNTFCDCGECYSPNMSMIPTADVVEVTYCKDCEFAIPDESSPYFCIFINQPCGDNDYCSRGIRKEQK